MCIRDRSECATISMAAGHPLTDEDRWPWLDTIAAWIDERVAAGDPAVVTCSALKKIYRDKLRRQGVVFVYMQGTDVYKRQTHAKDSCEIVLELLGNLCVLSEQLRELIDHEDVSRAVSYTHLDVYKRQLLAFSENPWESKIMHESSKG